MRFFQLSPDEIVIVDENESEAVLVMARDDKLPPEAHVELETYREELVCKNCEAAGAIFWAFCDECPKEVQPR